MRRRLVFLAGGAAMLGGAVYLRQDLFSIGIAASGSRVLLTGLNTLHMHNYDQFTYWTNERYKDKEHVKGLLTVSNHASIMDDPGLIGVMLPIKMWNTHDCRWTVCAKEMCFSNPFSSAYFRAGNVLPVDRRGGLEQDSLYQLSRRLSEGDWVHLFPEGKVIQECSIGPFKRGVGKLYHDAITQIVSRDGQPLGYGTGVAPLASSVLARLPLVLPFYHRGLEAVKPVKKSWSTGHTIDVLYGEFVDLSDMLRTGPDGRVAWTENSPEDVYRVVTSRLETALWRLKPQMDALHPGCGVAREERVPTRDDRGSPGTPTSQ